MQSEKDCPVLRGEKLYVPFVGAIIERKGPNGQRQILIQTRVKESDSSYSGRLEIPSGKMQAFEDVYDTIKREVLEETGLKIISVIGKNQRVDHSSQGVISSIIEPFCVTQMQDGPFVGLIFLCEAIGEPKPQTEEAKDATWMDIQELQSVILSNPERIYTAFLAPLQLYIQSFEL